MKYIKTFESQDIQTKIFNCMERDDVQLLQDMLNKGVNFNFIFKKSGDTPLVKATYDKEDPIFYTLLNDPNVDVNMANYVGWTPLIMAASDNNSIYVDALIQANADWNIKNDDGLDFVDCLKFMGTMIRTSIIEKYPEKYKDAMIKKESEKYNL